MYQNEGGVLFTGVKLLLAALFLLGTYVAGSTYEAPTEMGLTGSLNPAVEAQKPFNTPEWTAVDRSEFPGCTAHQYLGDVVIVTQANDRKRVTFDHAWTVTHNQTKADDVWVIGWCH